MDIPDSPVHPNPQTLLSWKAPLRAYKKRSAGVLRFYIALALLLSLIVYFFGDTIIILPIWALVFLFYVLTITPPPEIEHKITRFGIATAGNTYRFDTLSHFYFTKKFDHHVLVVVGRAPYFFHLYLVMSDEVVRHEVTKILSTHLIFQEDPHKTLTDKIVGVLTALMPEDSSEGSRVASSAPTQEAP